jgi:hypothetical protein
MTSSGEEKRGGRRNATDAVSSAASRSAGSLAAMGAVSENGRSVAMIPPTLLASRASRATLCAARRNSVVARATKATSAVRPHREPCERAALTSPRGSIAVPRIAAAPAKPRSIAVRRPSPTTKTAAAARRARPVATMTTTAPTSLAIPTLSAPMVAASDPNGRSRNASRPAWPAVKSRHGFQVRSAEAMSSAVRHWRRHVEHGILRE